MPNQHGESLETQISSILPLRPRLGQDLFQMDAQIWAIHGYIPVDGEVILAEFDQRETAAAVLADLAAAQEHSRYPK
jgi:hypothetical protein